MLCCSYVEIREGPKAQEQVGSFDYQTPQASCSYYGHSQRHAVRKAGATVYCYDANGDMTSRGGSLVSYTSYNLPAVINGAGASSQFWYTPERRRWKQVAQSSAGTETTIHVGGQLEKVTRPAGTEQCLGGHRPAGQRAGKAEFCRLRER
jgi:hypothetical protein